MRRIDGILVFTLLAFQSRGLGQTPFTEEAIDRGLSFSLVQTPAFGYGVAFADLDQDGDPDVVAIGDGSGRLAVWENDGAGQFTERFLNGITGVPMPSGIIACDYDNDGDLDLYLSNYGAPNILARNDGNFVFVDVTDIAGVGDAGYGTGSVWGDYDGDGWVDLYVANRTTNESPPLNNPNRLYRNLGDGTFEDVAGLLGVDDTQLTYQAVFFDFDNDHDADLYLITDKGQDGAPYNRLFENTGGSFTEISVASGAGVHMNGMSGTVGDFDGNGFQDLYITNTPPGNVLLLNQGNKTFVEFASEAGVESFETGWGAMFLDYDNDGHQDLFVINQVAANRLYAHGGVWPATDVAPATNIEGHLDSGGPTGPRYFGVAYADVDADGDLDILMPVIRDRLRLYINNEGSQRHWLRVHVIGQPPNRSAVGAKVKVRVGSVWQLREVLCGSNSFKSQNELTVHFGLDDAEFVDEVVVIWPGGEQRTLYDVATNQTLDVQPLGAVPSVSHWGLLIMTLLLMSTGVVMIHRIHRLHFCAAEPEHEVRNALCRSRTSRRSS